MERSIPITGPKWDLLGRKDSKPISPKLVVIDPEKRSLNDRLSCESEVATVRGVGQQTTLPVPEVFGHGSGGEKGLGTPCMFLEYINGRPYSFPFDKRDSSTGSNIEEKTHEQLATFDW